MTNTPPTLPPSGNIVVGGSGSGAGRFALVWQKLGIRYRLLAVAGAGMVLIGVAVVLGLHANKPANISSINHAPQQTATSTKNGGGAQNGQATTQTPASKPGISSPSDLSNNKQVGGSAGSTGGTSSGGTGSAATSGWPNASNTGYEHTGVTLHSCPSLITSSGTYDSCHFTGGVDVRANDVHITRSLIDGDVAAYSGDAGQQTGLVISDTTINCGCQSTDDSHTQAAINESNYTLLRVNLYNSGHGAAVRNNVLIQDSYIHGLGGNTEAHKDGIFSGDGTKVTIKHNNIECNDGAKAGCTSAIGLLTDFADITYYTIDNNLLNTNGSYCFYASGGPQKSFSSNHLTFTNNHFGRADNAQCGFYGPVTYWDSAKPGMVWSGNVWDDTGATVPPAN